MLFTFESVCFSLVCAPNTRCTHFGHRWLQFVCRNLTLNSDHSYKPSLRFVSYRQFIINSQFTPKQQRSTVSPHRMSNKSTVFRLIKPSIQKGYHTSVLPASCRNRTLLKFSRSSNFQGFLQLKKQKKQVLSVNINCCYTFKIKVF